MMVDGEQISRVFSSICLFALLLKLFFSGLYRQYRLFTILIAVALLQEVALLPLSPQTNPYAWVYFFSSPVLWILEYLVLLELYALALEKYPAIRKFGGRALLLGLFLAIVGCAFSVLLEVGHTGDRFPVLRWFQITQRTVTIGVLILVGFISLFSSWFPIVLNRNSARYLLGYAVYFSAKSAALLALTRLGFDFVESVNVALVLIPSCVVAFWAIKLNSSGEMSPAVLARQWSAREKERLLQQLESVDSFLSRAGKSIA